MPTSEEILLSITQDTGITDSLSLMKSYLQQAAIENVGADGDDGLSAYEVAVENGFVGTEPEWLLSLKGAKGDTGLTGTQGLQGIQGLQGETGPQGIQGIQGIAGTNGLNGLDGSPDSASDIKTKLETLTENNRLDASAIKNIPTYDLSSKVDVVAGKGLSTNDLTDTLKNNYDTAYSSLGDIQTALTAILGV